MVDCDGEDLRQQVDLHVDRAPRQGACAPAVAAPEAVDVGEHHRIAALRGRRDLGSFTHLVLPIAVDLGHRDLRQVVLLEERIARLRTSTSSI